MQNTWILAAAIFCGSDIAADPGKEAISEARTEAEANIKAPGGPTTAADASARFVRARGESLRKCRRTSADTAAFSILVKLSRRGLIKEYLLEPETKAGLCLMQGAGGDTLSAPPGPNWWVRIDSEGLEIRDPIK